MKTNRRRNERNGISDWNCFPSFVDARRRRTNRPTAANFGLCPEEGRRMTLLPRGHNQAKNESQSGLQEGWRRERGAHFSTPPLLLPRLVVHKIRTYRFIKTHYPSHPPSLSLGGRNGLIALPAMISTCTLVPPFFHSVRVPTRANFSAAVLTRFRLPLTEGEREREGERELTMPAPVLFPLSLLLYLEHMWTSISTVTCFTNFLLLFAWPPDVDMATQSQGVLG